MRRPAEDEDENPIDNPVIGESAVLQENEMRLSIAVPCFNEEATLPELHRRATRVAEGIVSQDFEMVITREDWPIIEAQSTVMATHAAREGRRTQAVR